MELEQQLSSDGRVLDSSGFTDSGNQKHLHVATVAEYRLKSAEDRLRVPRHGTPALLPHGAVLIEFSSFIVDESCNHTHLLTRDTEYPVSQRHD